MPAKGNVTRTSTTQKIKTSLLLTRNQHVTRTSTTQRHVTRASTTQKIKTSLLFDRVEGFGLKEVLWLGVLVVLVRFIMDFLHDRHKRP